MILANPSNAAFKYANIAVYIYEETIADGSITPK